MHKQKRISLNILLTACLLLASLWGGVILNAVKNRSTADATRWREFLYASQVDDREAIGYEYDETTGWEYSYGTWTDDIVNTLEFTTHAQKGDTGITYKNDDNYEFGLDKLEDVFTITKKDADKSFDSVVLYTKKGETGLYYNGQEFFTGEEWGQSQTQDKIYIGQTEYDATLLGGSVSTPTYYIIYPLNALYAKYSEKNLGGGKPNKDNNFGFKLYLDEGCTIEYVGKGELTENPVMLNLGDNYNYDIIWDNNKENATISLNTKDEYTPQIYLFVKKGNDDDKYKLYYNGAEYTLLGDWTYDEQNNSITIGETTIDITLVPGTADNPQYYFPYDIFTLYMNDNKLYLDEAHTIEYVGEASKDSTENKKEYQFNYKLSYWAGGNTINEETNSGTAYSFSDPNTDRMIWEEETETNSTEKYLVKDVDAEDNFAQSQNDVVILENYLNNINAKENESALSSGQKLNYEDYLDKTNRTTYGINNFYVSFGGQVKTSNNNIILDENGNAKIISALSVTAYLNNESTSSLADGANKDDNYGVRIQINNINSQSAINFDSINQNLTNYYWYDYFDLTQVSYILNDRETKPLLNAYGLYTIVFNYTVSDYASGMLSTTKEQYVYQFYLTDDTNYVMYPTLNNTAQQHNEYYSDDNKKYSTTYFNMNTYNLPTYLFDASKYNVTYTYTSTENLSYTFETSFKLFDRTDENHKLGLLSIGSDSYVIKLDDTKNRVEYYKGNESTTLTDDNLYGYIEIKEVTKEGSESSENYDYTALYLHLNGVTKYEDGMLIRKVAKDTPLSYYFPIVITELGEYTFENKYIIQKDAYNFTVINQQAKNIFKNYTYDNNTYSHAYVLNGMTYENGIYVFKPDNLKAISESKKDTNYSNSYNNSKDGGYNLIFLGTKSTFMKNKTATPFQDVSTGVYADITGSSWKNIILSDWETLTNLSNTWTETITDEATGETTTQHVSKKYEGLASQIPITNLSPVAFNLYGGLESGTIYYWKKNLTQNNENGGYYITDDDLTTDDNLIICGAPTKQTFTNGASLERAGLYIISVKVKYQDRDEVDATATQYFMFVIDNSDPDMYFYTGDYPSENKLGMSTKYTNATALKFYWDEPSYFQEDVTAYINYNSSYKTGEFGSSMIYTKGNVISSSNGSSSTAEGAYHISVYYGQKPFFNDDDTDRSCREATIYVDRTAPIASFYTYTTKTSNGETSFSYEESTSLISNGKFRLYSDKTKKSGAIITVKYTELNFSTNTEDAKLLQIGEKYIVTTDTSFDYVSDSSISSQFYNLLSTEDSIVKADDDGQNLTLGSDNSATPSKLYIFNISDEAGNSATYYYIFDNSTPRAVYLQKDEESGNLKQEPLDSASVSETTQINWGNEKGILLNVKYNVEGENSPKYNTITNALKYISDNSTTLYKGFGQKTEDGKNYLTLPLSDAVVNNSKNDNATTTSASQITIVTKQSEDTYNDNSYWEIAWKDNQNSDKTISYFVSQNKTTYTSTITDILGNKSVSYRVYLDTDLANLTIFANNIEYESDKVDTSKGINSESINANNATIYFKKDIAVGIESYVTYSYYPFAMTSYLNSNAKFEKNTVSNINGDSQKAFSVTYPFSQEPLYKDQVVNSGDVLLKYKEEDKDLSQEGLYVLNRVYKYTDTKEVLTEEQVKSLSENDSANINMYIVVDRQGIVKLITDNTGKVLTSESIGDLIYFTLGDGTDDKYKQDIDAGTLNNLAQNSNEQNEQNNLFTTNKVKVSTHIPLDKYATALKLNDDSLTGITEDAENTYSTEISEATAQNNVLFGLYVTLSKKTTDQNNNTVYNAIVLNNEITEAGSVIINSQTKQSFEKEYSLSYLLSMVQNGEYRIYISDKKLISVDDDSDSSIIQVVENDNVTHYTTASYSSFYKFDYKIDHKLPIGNYVSKNIELDLLNNQNYRSVNKDVLSFEFEDDTNQYQAKVDPNNFTVVRQASGSAVEEILLKRENGNFTISSGLTNDYILENIFIETKIGTNPDSYKYTLNIFNKSSENVLLSDCEGDYTYKVTICYVGEEGFYEVVDQNGTNYEKTNYFKATYTIHQDTTAPSQNLNNLKSIANEYAGEVDENSYFFAVDRNNPGLSSTNTDESYEIYLREIDLSSFKLSLLPGDEGYGGTSTGAPSFNPNSIDTDIYKNAWTYSSADNNISFSEYDKGYYELLELDMAQNITRYLVYLDDTNSKLYVNINYNQNSDNNSNKNSVEYNSFDVSDYTNPVLDIFTLNSIESFIINDDDEIVKYDNGNFATSAKDYHKINETDYYFDKFVVAYIKDKNGNTLKTVVCDGLEQSLNSFYKNVVDEFKNIQEQNKESIFEYQLEILNRFGDNYVATFRLPDAELALTINDKTDYFEVILPAQSGNVYLTSFKPERANGSQTLSLTNDSTGVIIITDNASGLQSAAYKFAKGDYKFTIVDNYGRKSEVFKFFGSDTDDKYVFNLGDNYITKEDSTLGTILYTNKTDTTLNINNSIWGVTIYYGKSLNELKDNINKLISTNTDYTISNRVDSRGKYTYTFSKEGFYRIETTRQFGQSSSNVETITFCIDSTKPKAYAIYDSGLKNELILDKSGTYSLNITLVWESAYDLTGTLVHVSEDGETTTYTISADDASYYINTNGTYTLTLTDAISNTNTWTFDKIDSAYTYYTVKAKIDENNYSQLAESKYISFYDDSTTIVRYYYVKYKDTPPEIIISPDNSQGILCSQTVDNNNYVEYKIYTTKGESQEYIINYVRVVFVEETDDFGGLTIQEDIDKDGKNSEKYVNSNSTTYAKKLELSFNKFYNPEEDDSDNTIYNGNTIYLLHYFNGELVKQYNGDSENTFYITRSGLHSFKLYDQCGNSQEWGQLYVINSVIYTLNGQNPIPNSFYNDEVKLSIVDKFEGTTIYTCSATALLNGKPLEGFDLDENGEYTFNTPGYYTITMTANLSETQQLTETINFIIINENVAMIAFNIPTSYGFTIESIFKNQAEMTDSIQNKSTLWLSANNEVFGSGVFTITASYYDSSLGTTYYFSFKVWINEETPIIIPVNYTYGTKTSKSITLQYNGGIIYSQIGLGYIRILNAKGNIVDEYEINAESPNEVKNLTINATGEFTVALYNNEGKLVSSYKVIKTKPLNSSAKIIIIIVVCVTAVLTGIFIFLRRRLKFR